MTYNFATLNATLTGAHASEARRNNNPFATNDQMYTALLHCLQHGPIRIGHGVALRDAQNAGLLKLAPLTEQQERTRARNANAKLSRKVVINADGVRYLRDLDRAISTPKPKPDRATLRQYERRFSTAARWAAALYPPLSIHDALNTLYAEHAAHVMDTRAFMGGAI